MPHVGTGRADAGKRCARPSQVHPRRAPRKSYHIRDLAWIAVCAALALSLLACAKGVYDVGYGNGLKAQEVPHAQR